MESDDGGLGARTGLPQMNPMTLPRKESGHPVVHSRGGECRPPVGNANQGPHHLHLMRAPRHSHQLSSQPHQNLPEGRSPTAPITWENILQPLLSKHSLSLSNSPLEAAHHVTEGHGDVIFDMIAQHLGRADSSGCQISRKQ